VSSRRPGARHQRVTHLEPSRRAAAVGAGFGVLVFGAAAAAVGLYRTESWPVEWRLDEPPPDRVLVIAAAVLGALALLCLVGVVVNGRRWRLARRVERWSNDPALVAHLPPADEPPPAPPAIQVPPLSIEHVRDRKLPKPPGRRRRVTPDANVYGAPPMRIAYLRLFENRPRTRTFVESAWREFGHVYFLRSAGSVTPREFREITRAGGRADMFITSRAQLEQALGRSGAGALGKGRHAFREVGPTTLRVRDRYGCYPMTALLCHGSFWRDAVDVLLEHVDLVALDLSGLRPENEATRYELQRVLDRFPVRRIVLLVDEHSNRAWLDALIRDSWSRMAASSPNATPGARTLLVATTDRIVRQQSSQTRTTVGPSGGVTTTTTQGPVRVRLVANRAATRRLVATAQQRAAA